MQIVLFAGFASSVFVWLFRNNLCHSFFCFCFKFEYPSAQICFTTKECKRLALEVLDACSTHASLVPSPQTARHKMAVLVTIFTQQTLIFLVADKLGHESTEKCCEPFYGIFCSIPINTACDASLPGIPFNTQPLFSSQSSLSRLCSTSDFPNQQTLLSTQNKSECTRICPLNITGSAFVVSNLCH